MTVQERSSRRQIAITLLVFPLVGPTAAALTIAVPLALLGLFTLGPGGLLYYLFLAAWWLPGMYKLLAPPFLLAGVFVAFAGAIVTRPSILVAFIAAELAFSVYFAFWLLVPGGVEAVVFDYAKVWSVFRGQPWSVLIILVATAACWLLIRALDTRGPQAIPDPGSSDRAAKWKVLWGVAATVIGAMTLAAVFAISARSTATAWKDCTEGDAEDALRGCTVILDRAADESTEKRVAAYLRRGHFRENLKTTSPAPFADYSEVTRLAPDRAEGYGRRRLAYARRDEHDGACRSRHGAAAGYECLSSDTLRRVVHLRGGRRRAGKQ
jgi:hypothetical protein